MVCIKKDLKQILRAEKKLYLSSFKRHMKLMVLHEHDYLVWKYMRALRHLEYHENNNHIIRKWVWRRKMNKVGAAYGISVSPNCVGEGLRIWHYGDIIVHNAAKIGKNCHLHGMNCIGNKGTPNSGVPTIGDNVDVGVGAVIIGDVHIADGVRIGANAVVTKSCYEKGALLMGIPAKVMSKDD